MKRVMGYLLLLVILPCSGWTAPIRVFFDPPALLLEPENKNFEIILKADIPEATPALSWTLDLLYDPNVLDLKKSTLNSDYWTDKEPLFATAESELAAEDILFGFVKTKPNGDLIPIGGLGIELTTLIFEVKDTDALPTEISASGDPNDRMGFFLDNLGLVSIVPEPATISPVPAPSSILLLAGGLTALVAGRRRLFPTARQR